MGIFFWAANFQIFLGIPDILNLFLFFIIFFFYFYFFFFLRGGGGVGVNSRCWVQAYV